MTVAPSKQVIADLFDVYIDGRRVIYLKEDCHPADLQQRPFFSRVVPVNHNDLPRSKRQDGFIALRNPASAIVGDICVVQMDLPDFSIRYLWTGQFDAQNKQTLWDEVVAFDSDHNGEGGEEVALGKRIIASGFNVYLNDRFLVYRQEECSESDRMAPFFLHVVPVDEDALPPDRVQYGFDNYDFEIGWDLKTNEFGCSIRTLLPAYAIRHIHTGQYVPGGDKLWEGKYSMEPGADDGNGGRGMESGANPSIHRRKLTKRGGLDEKPLR